MRKIFPASASFSHPSPVCKLMCMSVSQCIVMMNQEDGAASDIQSVQSAQSAGTLGSGSGIAPGRTVATPSAVTAAPAAPVCACGQIEVAFAYDAPMRHMTVHLLQARDIPARDRGGSTHTQVRADATPGASLGAPWRRRAA